MNSRDPARYEALYGSLCRSLHIPYDLWDDAKQEMRIAVWQGRNAQYGAIDFIRKWTGFNRRRREARESPISIDGYDRFWNVPAPPRMADEYIDLERALPILNARELRVLLGYALGYTGDEIGARLGISESYVSYLARGARVKLRPLVALTA